MSPVTRLWVTWMDVQGLSSPAWPLSVISLVLRPTRVGFNFFLNTRTDCNSQECQIPLQRSELNFRFSYFNSLNHAASLKTEVCCQNSYFVYIINSSVCVILNTFQKTRDQNNFVQLYNTGVERRGFLYDGY